MRVPLLRLFTVGMSAGWMSTRKPLLVSLALLPAALLTCAVMAKVLAWFKVSASALVMVADQLPPDCTEPV